MALSLPSTKIDFQEAEVNFESFGIQPLRFARVRAYANSDTFDIKPIGELVRRYLRQSTVSIDPFARNKRWATYTNDLNPKTEAEYHLDSAIFLERLVAEGVQADLVLFDPPYCYDGETEVFTLHGWKSIRAITKEDEVATLNSKTNSLEYDHPTAVIRKRYHGLMYRFDSQSVDLLVTPNHKLWIKKSFYGDYSFVAAKDLDVKTIWMQKACAPYLGSEQDVFILPGVSLVRHNRHGETFKPDKSIPMDVWLKFLGLFLSEGCSFSLNGKSKYNYRIGISQKKPEVRAVIESILDEMGYTYWTGKTDYRIQDKQLYTYLSQLGKAREKYIPEEFKSLSPRQTGILIDHMMLGDGCRKTYYPLNKQVNKRYPHTTNVYHTGSKRLMDDFCELAVKAGFAITVGERKERGIYKQTYRIKLLGSQHFRVYSRNIKTVEDFDDWVYCVSVPNQLILVKRGGKIVWSGNSVHQTKECYESIGLTLGLEDVWRTSGWKRERKAICKLVKVGGYVICCNWNTNGIGEYYGFKAIELLDVCHGWGHPDTLVLVEQKIAYQMELAGFNT